MDHDVREAVAAVPTRSSGGPAAMNLPTDDERPLDLLEAAELLRSELAGLRLPLEVPEVAEGRRERDQLLAQLDDYLLPRLRRMDAPILAVVGGSTGAGKSTLVNSLMRREVTRSSVLRPTTRSPVLVHNPYDSGAFLSQRILPGLGRVTSEAPEPAQPIDVDAPKPTALRLVPHEGMPPGIAIVDAPDIDSLVDTNRELAFQLLAAADLWIFVTTAARYSDNVPWQALRSAVDRGVSVAVVLDRVPEGVLQQVRTHLATMLRDRGLATSPLFTITETEKSPDGFLPRESVQPLVAWLTRLSRDSRSRDVVIRRTLVGALDSLRGRIPVIATAADEQVAADERLRDELDEVYGKAAEQVEQRLGDASLLRGELLALWHDFVGTGDIFRSLEATVSRVGDRLGTFGAQEGPAAHLSDAGLAAVHSLVRADTQRAADAAINAWQAHPEGVALLDGSAGAPVLTKRLSLDFDDHLARSLAQWREDVIARVQAHTMNLRPGSRNASLGAEALTLMVMLAVFTRDVPQTDASVESAADASSTGSSASDTSTTAAATSEVTQRLLEAVVGEQAAHSLIDQARSDLIARSTAQLDSERSRIESLLDDAQVRDGRGEMLRALGTAVEEAR